MYQKYNFEKLEIYCLSEELLIIIYNLVKSYPTNEIFVFISQIKRSALSIVLNIAEGSSRKSKKDFAHFIDISIGSLFELKTLLLLSLKLKYINQKDLNKLLLRVDQLFFKLLAFKKYLLK